MPLAALGDIIEPARAAGHGVGAFNVIGEIPGTTKPDEIVMLGGHFDSWQGGTGATDNGTGSSVAMEAVRILATLHKPMARTVRVALWGGEGFACGLGGGQRRLG